MSRQLFDDLEYKPEELDNPMKQYLNAICAVAEPSIMSDINNVDFEYQPEYNKDSKVMKDIKRIKRMKNA